MDYGRDNDKRKGCRGKRWKKWEKMDEKEREQGQKFQSRDCQILRRPLCANAETSQTPSQVLLWNKQSSTVANNDIRTLRHITIKHSLLDSQAYEFISDSTMYIHNVVFRNYSLFNPRLGCLQYLVEDNMRVNTRPSNNLRQKTVQFIFK